MNENKVGQIENYLSGDMAPAEKLYFEEALSADAALQELLRVYKTIDTAMFKAETYHEQDAALKHTLQKLNADYFKTEAPVVHMKNSTKMLRVALSAAAGLVLILLAYIVFLRSADDTRQLANTYIKNELTHLSQTMDGAKDSLQQAISTYNAGQYTIAVEKFETIYQSHPENSDALKYAGITYLVTKEYDKALEKFTVLATRKELFSNPGMFLKAITLLERNKEGDKKEAERLLQQVVDEKAEGSKEAAKWLKQ